MVRKASAHPELSRLAIKINGVIATNCFKGDNMLSIVFSHAEPRAQANPRPPGNPERLSGVGSSDLVGRWPGSLARLLSSSASLW